MAGIYIHVPFCDGKCPYCDFYSLSNSGGLMDAYVRRVCDELKRWSSSCSSTADTLYFGGGTPSLLGVRRLETIIHTAKECFGLVKSEITVEVNPTRGHSLDFAALRRAGANRLSIGLQSSHPEELRLLGRRHSAQDAANTVRRAQEAGFHNLSLDLMLAVPGQTQESLRESVDFCRRCGVPHISAYLLKVEKGTPYAAQQESLCLMDEDAQADQYLLACSLLEEAGYQQYEISNFARAGFESRHNLKYWNCEETLGIGPSAHSFWGGKRFYCPKNLAQFLDQPRYEPDGTGGSEEEYSMLRLRLTEGLREDRYIQRFGHGIPARYRKNAEKFCGTGLLSCDEQGIRLTRSGFLLSNGLIAEILL